MSVKTQINAILNKKMDRQDFIKHLAVAAVALSGAGAALRLLSQKQPSSAIRTDGYGGSAYGGIADKK